MLWCNGPILSETHKGRFVRNAQAELTYGRILTSSAYFHPSFSFLFLLQIVFLLLNMSHRTIKNTFLHFSG